MSYVFMYIEYEYSKVMVSTVTETQENSGAVSLRQNINMKCPSPAEHYVRWMNMAGYGVLTFFCHVIGMVGIYCAELNFITLSLFSYFKIALFGLKCRVL